MRRAHAIELVVGGGLLLGPLVYALTLPVPEPAPTCAEPEVVVEQVCASVCEHPEPPNPAVEPEIQPEPEPEPEPEVAIHDPAALILVADGRLVLSTEAEASWGRGRFYEPKGEASFRVARRAKLDAIPESFREWRGRSFDLYGPEGKVCTAHLGRLEVVAQYDGWGLEGVLGWDEWSEYEEPEQVPASKWRAALWAEGERWLVARVESPTSCEGALWARDAALPAPTILAPSDAPNPLADARLADFARSLELGRMRADYQAWYAELDDESKSWEPDWATMSGRHPATVRSWMRGDEPALLELDFGANFGGCGEGYDARVTATERVDPNTGALVPLDAAPDALAIFDADLDGEFELLHRSEYETKVWVDTRSAFIARELSVEYDFECPC